jgi:hypothetical protein
VRCRKHNNKGAAAKQQYGCQYVLPKLVALRVNFFSAEYGESSGQFRSCSIQCSVELSTVEVWDGIPG